MDIQESKFAERIKFYPVEICALKNFYATLLIAGLNVETTSVKYAHDISEVVHIPRLILVSYYVLAEKHPATYELAAYINLNLTCAA